MKTIRTLGTGLLLVLCLSIVASAATADVSGSHTTLQARASSLSSLSFTASRSGVMMPGGLSTGLGQRAIDDDRDKPTPADDDDDDSGDPQRDEPNAPDDMGIELVEESPKSPVTAMLLSAVLPGTGQLYVGSATGYAFLGVEAVSWITWASFSSSSDTKEDEMFEFADRNFSQDLFSRNCVGQDGQSCAQASSQLNDFWLHDRAEYYEIISKNTIYKSGWGKIAFENQDAPEFGTEEYRVWIADLSQAQDGDFISYNEIRDDRNDLSRTSRSMMVVVLLNRVAAAWHAFWLAGGLKAPVGNDFQLDFDVQPSFSHPGASVTLSRNFF